MTGSARTGRSHSASGEFAFGGAVPRAGGSRRHVPLEDELDDDDLPAEVDSEEWNRSTTSLRCVVDTDASLASVLGVTRPAVQRALESGRIERTPDRRWHVFWVVKDWRAHTRRMLQRSAGTSRPWLDPWKPWSRAMRGALIRRTRAVGGTVEAYDLTARGWQPLPDPMPLLLAGQRMSVAEGDWLEVDYIIDGSGIWLDWFTSAAPRIAEACGADPPRLQAALEAEGRRTLGFMLHGALTRQGWTADLEEELRQQL